MRSQTSGRSSSSDAWESYGANPGRMLFMRDGTLLVTVGDRDRYCCDGSENTSQRMKAQTLDNDYGKILRIRDDGSIPPDNPFVGVPARCPRSTATGIAMPTAWPTIPRRANSGNPRSVRWAATRSTSCRPGTTTGGRWCRRAATTPARPCPIVRGPVRAWTIRGCSGIR